MMLLSYGIPRALWSLSANWRVSLNSMLIIAASLSVLGMGVLLYLNVIHFSRVWLANTTISLFLNPGLTADGRGEILERVRTDPMVIKARQVAPEEGLRVLGEKLGNDHGLLDGVDSSALPYTIDFEIAAEARPRIHTVVARFIGVEGVDEVVYAERSLESVKLFFALTEGVGLFFIALIGVSFFMVVSNAIRLSLHTRRDEIEILWAVGATHRTIRSSFIIEGVLLSIAGFGVAVGIVWFGYQLIIAALTWNETTMLLRQEATFFSGGLLLMALAAAVAVGGVGSHLSVNRVLRGIEE